MNHCCPASSSSHARYCVHNPRGSSSRQRESCRDGLCCVQNLANSPAPKNTYRQQKHKHTQTKRAHKSKTRTSPIGRGLTGIRASEGVQTALPTHTLGVLLHLQSGVLLHLLIGAPFADRRLTPVADRILNPFVARARAFWFARFCQ